MKGFARALIWVLVSASIQDARAQVLHAFMSPNPEVSGAFGLSVSGAGDTDIDGYADLAVGACYENGGAADAGRAYIMSGRTGNPLHVLMSPNPEIDGYFGCSVSGAGDVDNDGYADIVVGADSEDGGEVNAGRAYVFSGQTGGPIHTLLSPNAQFIGYFGTSVSGAGETDGDGFADLIVGAHYEDGGDTQTGRAYIFSGQTGALHMMLESPNPESYGHFGISVSGAGDVKNDGFDDVIVGACYESAPAPDAGRAYVFNGQTGVLLHTLVSPNADTLSYFGYSVSGAGDVNADGYADLIVGAHYKDGGPPYTGRAYVFSGQTGGLLYTLVSPNAQAVGFFGYSVSGAGDVNGDGFADVTVGAYLEDGGAVSAGRGYVFSGCTGKPLYTLLSTHPEIDGYFGFSVSGAGDVNNDGLDDVVAGAYNEDAELTDDGRAYVFAIPPPLVLSSSVTGGQLVLQWPEVIDVAEYWVYGAENQAYFEPGLTSPWTHRVAQVSPPTTAWSSSNGVAIPYHDWTYLILAVNAWEQELVRSNRVGEFDYSSVP
ncbi:FG-GAP repeat protein [Candidatus Fermentibacteria bacterium]|nr:FG-GAP repeat protein [Candidatus Fermentibacteria bacterium]